MGRVAGAVGLTALAGFLLGKLFTSPDEVIKDVAVTDWNLVAAAGAVGTVVTGLGSWLLFGGSSKDKKSKKDKTKKHKSDKKNPVDDEESDSADRDADADSEESTGFNWIKYYEEHQQE